MTGFLLLLIGCGGAIFLAGLYAGLETAGYAANPLRLRVLANQGNTLAERTAHHLEDMGALVTITLIGHNLSVYLGTHILEHHIESLGWFRPELWATLILTPFCFIFAEVTPKQLGYGLAERYCLAGTRVLILSRWLFLPLTFFLGSVTWILSGLIRLLGKTPIKSTRREEILAHLDFGADSGLLDATQHRMAMQMMAVERSRVRHIVIPLNRVVSIKKTTTCARAKEVMKETGLHRLPLVDKRHHEVLGILTAETLMAKDLDPNTPAGEVAQTPVLLEAETLLSRACAKLQSGGARMGVAVSQGKVIGIITTRDLIAEILGMTDAEQLNK
ncbi:MAG: DUF21 domain-containing protein [Planctomycetes bacterium]|nr:DUF21 domain-containing protein [Planctomycetota bacterium]